MTTSWAWIPHAVEAYIPARLVEQKEDSGDMVFESDTSEVIIVPAGTQCIPIADPSTLNAPPEDLVKMIEVNDASILHAVRGRFMEENIYTSLGTILISVNPFKWIAGLYEEEQSARYVAAAQRGGASGGGDDGTPQPHVFAVTQQAFTQMCDSGNDQSLIISGESGAGKTEAVKKCLVHLTRVAGTAEEGAVSDRIVAAR